MTVYSPAINTYVPLESIVLTNAASSVSFFNISQSYRDLIVVVSGGIGTSGTTSVEIRFNGDTTAANYSMVWMEGTSGGAASSTSNLWAVLDGSNSNFILQVMDYSATDKHTTALIRSNSAGADVRAAAGRWANTAAVSSILIYDSAGQSLTAGTTLTLYAIAS